MTTRSVFIEQLASIASLKKSNVMTPEESHSVEQRILGELLALLQNDLRLLSHLQPMPEPPYTMEDVYTREKWIEQQKSIVSIVEGLQSRAKKVEHSLALSPPYDEASIEEAETSLTEVEQHWERCAMLEQNWLRIGREHTYPRSISLFELNEEEREYQLQKSLWERYQILEKKYLELRHPLTKLRYPFDLAVLEQYEEQYLFTVKWMDQIAQHKRVLLTRFHDQIDFPQLPFSSQDIVEYSKKVRPLLQRSKFLKYYAPLITVFFLGVLYQGTSIVLDYQHQSNLHEQVVHLKEKAKEIDWDLTISGPPYDSAEVEKYESGVKTSVDLFPRVAALESKAKEIGWDLTISGPPYNEVDVAKQENELSKNEALHSRVLQIKKKAKEIGWDLTISGPPYDSAEVEKYESGVKTSVDLFPRVAALESKAKEIGWDLTISGPPYNEVDVAKQESNLYFNPPTTSLKVKEQVRPRFPQAAKTLNIKKASCLVLFYIDEKGVPERTTIQGCAYIFHPAVEEAAMKWRFYPIKDKSGAGVKATFRLRITFKLN